jgi:3-oxoadipate enol-lactonase
MPHIEIEGVRIHYRLDGTEGAPALLLSNSLGTTLELWQPQLEPFGRHFRLLRYDTRGHGGSAVTPGPYTIDRLGRDALALLDALGLAKAQVCGLSMGGMIGQWLAIHAPERVQRLALCNTSAQIGAPEVWNERIATVRAKGMAAIVPAVIDRWFTKPFQEREPQAVARIRDMLLGTDPEGYVACCAAVRDMDQREGLAQITAPTLVIAGRHDLATPPEHAVLLARRIPGARLVELDAAHLSNIEAEAAFNAALLDFFAA